MKILNKLTIKHLKSNPKRTIVTVIGIILSTALMVGIGLIFATVRDNVIKDIIDSEGSYHTFFNIESNKLDIIANNSNVDNYYYISRLGFSKFEGSVDEYKPYIQVLSASTGYLKNLKLQEGRLPVNNNEILIPNHFMHNDIEINIGDTIELDIGSRVDKNGSELGNTEYSNYKLYEDDISDNYTWVINEKIINTTKHRYIVVGICDRDILEKSSTPSYNFFTTNNDSKILSVYVTYKNVKNTYKNTGNLANNLGLKKISENVYDNTFYNRDLLAMYGVSGYDNVMSALSTIICIILALVSIACIIVIYNSFAISVMERKKQFGLFASIGATKKQLRYTVFFEAFIVGTIGIILGILSSYLGIGVVIMIVNNLLSEVFANPLELVTYPLFIIIPILFMIITIIVSAYLPASKASKISPIEVIRQNDDIKIKSRKLKTNKLINKLFGIEGILALKNMKRNKKKYRITITSLFISIVLFISFSSLVNYGIKSSRDFTSTPEYEYLILVDTKDQNKLLEFNNKLKSNDSIKKIVFAKKLLVDVASVNIEYSDSIKDYYYNNYNSDITEIEQLYANIYLLDNDTYDNYKKELGLKTNQPILINTYKTIEVKESSRKTITFNQYKSVSNVTIKKFTDGNINIDDLYLAPTTVMGLDPDSPSSLVIVVNEELFNSLATENITENIFLTANKYSEIDKLCEETSEDSQMSIMNLNYKESRKLISNILLVIEILLYGFISLVTLIGVTSVLNTINTNIALRRKEFAVLRSIGLTPKGFNKILYFESLFFGLKSLLYGLPVGILITILLHSSYTDIVEFNSILIPWNSILISIVGVFLIVLISMWYSSRKIKKDNILDAIREENI